MTCSTEYYLKTFDSKLSGIHIVCILFAPADRFPNRHGPSPDLPPQPRGAKLSPGISPRAETGAGICGVNYRKHKPFRNFRNSAGPSLFRCRTGAKTPLLVWRGGSWPSDTPQFTSLASQSLRVNGPEAAGSSVSVSDSVYAVVPFWFSDVGSCRFVFCCAVIRWMCFVAVEIGFFSWTLVI